MANATQQLTADTRCTVYGAPGVIVQVDGDTVLVALDGEGARRDWWAAEQVEAVRS